MASEPFPGLGPGNHKVTVKGTKNPASSSASFVLKKAPNVSVSNTASGVTVTLSGGAANQWVNIIVNSRTYQVKLSGAGTATENLGKLSRGDYTVSARYFDNTRTGPVSGGIHVHVS